jgi:hypothetical protein
MKKPINLKIFLTIFVTAFVIACTPVQDDNGEGKDAGLDLGRTQNTEGGTWEVSITPEPDPLMSQMDFTLLVLVKRVDGEALAADLSIEADAFMPEHGHGMLPEVQPTTSKLDGDGEFRVYGMNLLMGGLWEIYIDVKSGEKTERATFSVQVEGEGSHADMDGGHMQMEDGGHMQMEDGGHMQMEDGGHMQMEDGGHMQMEDGGHMQMEDGGHMQMEDGGHMQMEDGGLMHMDAG